MTQPHSALSTITRHKLRLRSCALLLLCMLFGLGCGVLGFDPGECKDDLNLLSTEPGRRGCMVLKHDPSKLWPVQYKNNQFYFCRDFQSCDLSSIPLAKDPNSDIETALFLFPPSGTNAPTDLPTLYNTCTALLSGKLFPSCWNGALGTNPPVQCWHLYQISYARSGDTKTCTRWLPPN